MSVPADLYTLTVPVWNLILRAVVVYLSVLIILRIAGKRQLAQMSPTEFVAILLISNAVQNAMNGGDNSLVGGLVLAIAIIITSWCISALTYRHRRVRQLFEGTPTLMVYRGKTVEKNMDKEHLSLSELRALLREQGMHDFAEIHSAVLEADGHLSVIRKVDFKKGAREPRYEE
jgi:uncharacterized membrane protein YcaP (DUF421 family)